MKNFLPALVQTLRRSWGRIPPMACTFLSGFWVTASTPEARPFGEMSGLGFILDKEISMS